MRMCFWSVHVYSKLRFNKEHTYRLPGRKNFRCHAMNHWFDCKLFWSEQSNLLTDAMTMIPVLFTEEITYKHWNRKLFNSFTRELSQRICDAFHTKVPISKAIIIS